MPQQPPVIAGWILFGNRKIEVKVRYASKHSLWVEPSDGMAGAVVDNLELSLGNGRIDLGRCRLISDSGESGSLLRLVAVDRIYDFKKLFFRSEVVTLETAATNISIELGYKEKIDPEFKAYVSSLTYDLSVYAGMLDRFDSETSDEPGYVREHVHERIFSTVGVSLASYLDERLGVLGSLVSGYSEAEHEHHGYYFRRQMWHALLRAPIIARTNLKPRGYSGDSEMMRMVYANDYMGESTFGKILHGYSIKQPAAQAVRNRRAEIPVRIRSSMAGQGVKPPERFRILSVACGPAVEIGDLLATPADAGLFHFSLLDQDQQALIEAGGLVKAKEDSLGVSVSADFIRESVRTMLVTEQLKERWGLFHFIYSMGLFDYLTAPVGSAVLKKLYALLRPDGELVVGNMHVRNPSKVFMAYWHDWKIIHRTEEDLLGLASGLKGAEPRITFDETGIQMMLSLKKRAV